MGGRIDARIDDELGAKLAEINSITGQSTTAIIRAALAVPKPDPDLSTNYKKVLGESRRYRLLGRARNSSR